VIPYGMQAPVAVRVLPAQTAILLYFLDQYAGSPDHRVDCYVELALSSPAVAEVIAGSHFGGMARLSWPE